ncbi:MAG: 16S rRNA (guanine(527)-N(7))-methyltransferase RsmG [Alphaproteobacteria bacterium]|nr:16S rRNA (guanine(527)-N(7))-methyltransferase RsmG [Alphaproteobacteria bacterium]
MPPDIQAKLRQYDVLLHKWQKAINLVSPSSLEDSWRRHILDSSQLLPLLPEGPGRLVDLGSGGGFPGLVVAICRPDLEVHLIESDQRKCAFLQAVSRETQAAVVIHNRRIEDVLIPGFSADILTARALAPLSGLCDMVAPVFAANPRASAFFMKGRQAESEVAQARVGWRFTLDRHPSVTDPEAAILVVGALVREG